MNESSESRKFIKAVDRRKKKQYADVKGAALDSKDWLRLEDFQGKKAIN